MLGICYGMQAKRKKLGASGIPSGTTSPTWTTGEVGRLLGICYGVQAISSVFVGGARSSTRWAPEDSSGLGCSSPSAGELFKDEVDDAASEAAIFWQSMATTMREPMTTLQFDLIGKAAAAAGTTESQVRYWIRKGLIPTRTMGHRARPLLVEVELVKKIAREEQELGV